MIVAAAILGGAIVGTVGRSSPPGSPAASPPAPRSSPAENRPATSITVATVAQSPPAPPTSSPLAGLVDGSAPAPADVRLARAVLDSIPVEREHRGGYDRDLFPTWLVDDATGCTVRDRVLIDESLTPAKVDDQRCTVVAGTWYSSYDGVTLTDPADVQIDHLVPLKEAWDSGAWAWTPERRIAYANDLSDPRTLVAVSAASNQAKGAKDPSNWVPGEAGRCAYLADWIAVKARWGLSMDPSEWGRIKNLLDGSCSGIVVDPWLPSPG